jgi:predicted nucleic acid-binding protein
MKSLLFLAITEDIAEQAGRLKAQYAKRGLTLSFQDASIAAVCIAYNCTLITANAKDFPMPELQLYSLPKNET